MAIDKLSLRALLLATLAGLLLGCAGRPTAVPSSVPPTAPNLPATLTLTPTAEPSRTPAPSATASPTASPTNTALPSPTFTPDPYAGLYLDALRSRTYDGGTIQVLQTLAVTGSFTRTLFSYTSDGLTLQGFMNVPHGPGPFPVVIVNHGYINPAAYQSLTYMVYYTDPLAAAGFITLHPDYRGYGASDPGPNAFRIGYAIDVLNLVEAARRLPLADPEAIGLFGHSMGGGVSLRAITVNPNIKAAVLYGSMSGDETANFTKIAEWSGSQDLPELAVPAEVIDRIEPINGLDGIQAAVSLHHGEADATVPPAWSADLYDRLVALDKTVEYYSYPGQPHTFTGDGYRLFMQRVIAFFELYLREVGN